MSAGVGLRAGILAATPTALRAVRVAAAPMALLAGMALALAVAAPTRLLAQSMIRTEVDTAVVTVGDRITLTVSVEHPSDAQVEWPDSISLEPFEVLDARASAPRSAGERSVSTLALSLTAFELGALEIPSFEVSVIGPEGESETLETDRSAVEVVSVGADEGGDIREIRGPFAIPVGALRVLLTLLLVLLPALLAWLLYRRWRGRAGEDERGVRGPPPRPAYELALEALAALEVSPMLERGRVKEFHIEVSEILRTYIERRFRVDALEMTTREVLAGLERAGVDEELRGALRRFLEQCDLVKFAKVRPDAEASRDVLQLGRWIVERTIPRVPIPDVDVVERGPAAATPAGATPPASDAAAGAASPSASGAAAAAAEAR